MAATLSLQHEGSSPHLVRSAPLPQLQKKKIRALGLVTNQALGLISNPSARRACPVRNVNSNRTGLISKNRGPSAKTPMLGKKSFIFAVI